jgi:hypothetical protein
MKVWSKGTNNAKICSIEVVVALIGDDQEVQILLEAVKASYSVISNV